MLLAPTVLPSNNLAAQSEPRLAAAVRLAQDGLSDSARAVVGRILGSLAPTDSLYAEALYTMGFLAATETDRRLHLRRVVVDYAQSDWADDALLQLAQLDYAVGNTEGTVRQIEILLRDYPATPVAGIAAFWGARAAGDRRDAATACRMADAGLHAAGDDVELRNQLEFQKQRCQGLASMAAESARSPAAPPARPAEEPPGRTPTQAARSGYFVQVSAVRTRAAANTEIAKIKRAGYTAILVQESGLLKVRVGAFRTRAEADAAASEIRIRIGARPFVVRVP
ncbi:MAG TPA: SPOR domain-containing protein [Gemmatimonadales bacterium]|nr:SPOR domain-containing protein [Gemmatimonadales bacterium]